VAGSSPIGEFGDLREIAARTRRQRTVCFVFGHERGRAELTADGFLGVGIADLERGVSRIVGASLPRHFLRDVDRARRRSRGRRLAIALLKRLFPDMAEVSERRYEAGSVELRKSRSDEWLKVGAPDGGRTSRPNVNDPTWILRLLDAPAEAISEWRPHQEADECQIDFRIDLHRVADVLPANAAQRIATANEGDRMRHVPVRLVVTTEGIPRSVAVSLAVFAETGEESWQVIEFTKFGTDCKEADLWDRWERERPG
jgi:hypothetical protein